MSTLDDNTTTGISNPDTAILVIHGMGEQKNNATVELTFSAIKANSGEFEDSVTINGNLHDNPELVYEPPHNKPGTACYDENGKANTKECIHTFRLYDTNNDKSYDFLEVHWADITGGFISASGVVGWLIKRIPVAWKNFRPYWNFRPHLWRSTLIRLYKENRLDDAIGTTKPDSYLNKLLAHYDDYLQEYAIEDYRSTYRSFREYNSKPEYNKTLKLWEKEHTRWQGVAFLMLFAILLHLINVLLFVILPFALPSLHPTIMAGDFLRIISLTLIASIAGGYLAIEVFLRTYLGDVQKWIYDGKEDEHLKERREIIARTGNILKHVLQHPQYTRIILVGHSLGTSILHDTLIQLGKTDPQLSFERIQHIITFATPIDKIATLWDVPQSADYASVKSYEALRGSLADSPYQGNDIIWKNFWDKSDLFSNPIYTLQQPGSKTHIFNEEVMNAAFPELAVSHGWYFRHKTVIDYLSNSIFDDTSDKHEKKLTFWQEIPMRLWAGIKLSVIQVLFLLIVLLASAYIIGTTQIEMSVEFLQFYVTTAAIVIFSTLFRPAYHGVFFVSAYVIFGIAVLLFFIPEVLLATLPIFAGIVTGLLLGVISIVIFQIHIKPIKGK